MTGRSDYARRSRAVVITVCLAIACGLAGCDFLKNPNREPSLEPGSRQWIIRVVNRSARPATLFVAEDNQTMGRSVGTAVPSTVPAGGAQQVVFTVPPGQGWAIFVNPGPTMGPLVLAQDVPPDVSGVLPLTIDIARDGSPTVAVPDEPGWFGN